ncbi:MAG: heavy metal translocating P-type ATPase [Clostridia bacterium]|nr:heavy metal translocating P-type ATPase [Clostridia bacterium]
MRQFTVTGMSCAACSARVEKAVSGVEGVESCAVSLLTNSMGVEGNASDVAIIAAVKNAGYGAFAKGKESVSVSRGESLEDTQTPHLKRLLIASIVLMVPLMYLSMGHMMWGAPVPGFLQNPASIGLAELLLSAIVMIINSRFFTSGFKALWHRAPNMDSLVALGSGASFIYSVCLLFALIAKMASGGDHSNLHHFYFESAAMILTLISVGKMLEARSKGKTTDALRGLMDLSPKTAVIERNGTEEMIPIEELSVGDIFILRPGFSIPTDGIVIEGESAADESALTGESIPSEKSPGDRVYGATTNLSGFLRCRAERVGEDTTLSQIIRLMSDAAATKAPAAKLADKVSGIFVPVVIALAVICCFVWLLLGRDIGFSLSRAISILVISCPCALGLATPVAIMVGNGVGAKGGVLFKTALALEETGKIQIAALDKTGTITSGNPTVTDLLPADGVSEDELLRLAASLEQKSEHPLAKAILLAAKEKDLSLSGSEHFETLPGSGICAEIEGHKLLGASVSYASREFKLPPVFSEKAAELSEEGKTPLIFLRDGVILGMIAAADTVRTDSATAIAELSELGIRSVMLTGDRKATAEAIGRTAGVSEVIAEVLPGDKESRVRSLRENGKTAMIGDGINDAPALKSADIGIAIGAGADIAIDAADVVLMHSRLSDAVFAIRLSRAVLRNIRQNLFWAFFYNVIAIPLAAGVFIPITGWEMNPMIGAAAMSLSSFCVVTNALRLDFFRYKPKSANPVKQAEFTPAMENISQGQKETVVMEKTLNIKGMMCNHCEMHVKKALEALEGVESAQADFHEGTAVVKLTADVSDEAFRKAVEEAGYEMA